MALAIFLLSTGDLLIAGPKWDPSQGKPLATLNQMLAGVLTLITIFAGLSVLREVVRITRRRSSHHGTAHMAS